MRVISGFLRSRVIKGYDIKGTRPTMDKVKESIFAMIQNEVNNSTCLDLFAGSGSLGIEAISNGALKTYFVDNNYIAIKTIKENINNLKICNYSVILNKDYKDSLVYFKNNNIKFNIIFLDPPYKELIIENILKLINELNILEDNGIVICEYEKDSLQDNYGSLYLIKTKNYGDKNVNIYNKRNIL